MQSRERVVRRAHDEGNAGMITKRAIAALIAVLFSTAAFSRDVAKPAREPDYGAWGEILHDFYDPARGMDYAGLLARDAGKLRKLRAAMSVVDVSALDRKAQLAFWINLYNISVVGIVLDNYPVDSIRSISTDPIIRLNVFKKKRIPFHGVLISLNEIENERIREGFRDPRIHFAINCAAESCPPIRTEPYTGQRLDEQLDDQARRFLSDPSRVRLEPRGKTLVIHTSKILDWFHADFERWGGGAVAFIARYASPADRETIGRFKRFAFRYDRYSWKLNDWKR